jgi:hypothetical protein
MDMVGVVSASAENGIVVNPLAIAIVANQGIPLLDELRVHAILRSINQFPALLNTCRTTNECHSKTQRRQ